MSNAAETLDKIRAGAQQAHLLAIRRAEETIECLRNGDFESAFQRVNELQDRVSHLAHALSTLGVFQENHVMRASEVTVGLTLRGWGEVTGVRRVGDVMLFSFENDDEEQISADTEVAVVPEAC